MTNLAELAEEIKQGWQLCHSKEEVKSLLDSLTPMEQNGRSQVIEMAYPRLDLSFLRQRQSSGFPKFAVFSLDSPRCEFGWSTSTWPQDLFLSRLFGGQSEELATFLSRTYFLDVFEVLRCEAARRRGKIDSLWKAITGSELMWMELEAVQKFNGLLPKQVREEVKRANELWEGPTMLIADADEWVINGVRDSKVDPLIVKFDGEKYSSAFLISAFNVSKAEDLVAREFSTGNVSEVLKH